MLVAIFQEKPPVNTLYSPSHSSLDSYKIDVIRSLLDGLVAS